MTDPLSPEEIAQWREYVIADYPHPINDADLLRLLDVAEDHARLVAENAKFRERVGKLEAVRVAVVNLTGCGECRVSWSRLAHQNEIASALADCDEEEGS